MTKLSISRRTMLGAALLPAVAGLGGCSSPLPLQAPPPGGAEAAAAERLMQSAQAHGLAAYRQLRDVNIAYEGQWRPLIDRIQPEVVDAGYRGSSQERLMPQLGINAQRFDGPRGRKTVFWQRATPGSTSGTGVSEDIAVWRNGTLTDDTPSLEAAALVGHDVALHGQPTLGGLP